MSSNNHRRRAESGFTLIELMVVIIIMGVLSALAIPRFMFAVDKVRIADVPRVMRIYETAYYAAVVEKGIVMDIGDMIFYPEVFHDTKWFRYYYDNEQVDRLFAQARVDVGPFKSGWQLTTYYNHHGPNVGMFSRCRGSGVEVSAINKLLPLYADDFANDCADGTS